MLPDPAKSRAVIVGSSLYQGLDALPSVGNNVSEMAALLTDDWLWGLASEHCVTITDPRHPSQVLDALASAAAEASDTLVFYFAGHGVLRPDAYELYLALRDATIQRWWHAVRYDDIRRIMMESAAPKSKVVLLDCCYSGMAMMPGMGGGAEIGDRARIEGTYLMTASAETSVALAPLGERLTAFTGALVDAVRTGVPDGPDVLDFNTLYIQVRDALQAAGRPTPQQRSGNGGGRISLVRNVFYLDEQGNAHSGGRAQLTEDEQQALLLPPAQLADLVAEVRLRDGVAARRLLQAVGSMRTEQGVAAVVDHFAKAGHLAEIRTILTAAAGRRTSSLIVLLDAFRKTGQPERVGHLLIACAKEPPDRIAALAVGLHESGEPDAIGVLIDAAVETRMDPPKQLIAVIAALLSAGLDEQVDRILSGLGNRLPAPRILECADALRDAGHEQAAFSLYDVVVPLAAARPVAVAAGLAAAMHRAGRDRQARRLVDRMAGLHRTAADRVRLLDALWTARAPAGVADDLDYLDEHDLLDAIRHLYHRGQQENTRLLMSTALAGRPATTTARAIIALHEAGLPMEAYSLVEQSTAREAQEIVTIIGTLASSGGHHYAHRIAEKSISAEVLTALPEDLRRYAAFVLTRLSAADVVELAAGLNVEPMTWVLNTLPADVDPDLLGRPAFALSLVGLDPALRDRVCRRLSATVPIGPELITAAFSISFAEPATAVAHLLRLSDPASRPALRSALAAQAPGDLVQLLDSIPDLLDAVAQTGPAATQLYLMGWLENAGRGADADRLAAALRAAQPRSRVCALAATLDEQGHRRLAAALHGLQPGAPYDPTDLVVADLLAAAQHGAAPPDWLTVRARERGRLPPGTPVHRVVPREGNGRGTVLIFTDSALVGVLRSGRRVTIRYRHFDDITITRAGQSDIRLSADDKFQDLGVRDANLLDLLTQIQQAVHAVKELHAELSRAATAARDAATSAT
jgi:caspase domain-containing protein